jgi:DNA processing protein
MEQEMLYTIALSMVPMVGPVTAKELIKTIGSAEEVLKSSERKLLRVAGVGPAISQQLRSANFIERAEQEIRFLQKHQLQAIAFYQSEYPLRLKRCADSPLVLYVNGNSNFENRHIISIVGSRLATEYGKGICREFIQELRPYHPIIVSGLAYGIDITAHKEALLNGLDTLAIVGHGLDRIYPPTHTSVAKEIAKQGAIVSEFCSEVKPDRENFPARNRIIAGISDATIVVEAREQGGALITAEMANQYNRDVFAFPGRINDVQSKGCNQLIRNNSAQLLSSTSEFLDALGWDEAQKTSIQKKLFIDLTEEERVIVEYLIHSSVNVGYDQLLNHLNWKNSKLSTVLLQLEINGLIKTLPGSMFRLC